MQSHHVMNYARLGYAERDGILRATNYNIFVIKCSNVKN
jgi:hypothetical protein